MTMLKKWLQWASFYLTVVASAATAGTGIDVRDARVLATVPGQSVAAGYMTVRSAEAATLVSISSGAAKAVQIHTMSMQDGVMRMRPLDRLALPAGQEVRLTPGGMHLMLVGISQPLKAGGTVDLHFTVVKASGDKQTMTIAMPVVDGRDGHEHSRE